MKNVIKIEHTEVHGWEPAIRGMRNPMNSWEKSDSFICKEHGAMTNEEIEAECGKCPKCDGCDIYDREPHFIVGPNDLKLMTTLRNAGTADRKFMRMITVYVDLTAPLYWWKEFKTYRAGKRFGDDEPDVFTIPEDYLEYDIEMNSCSTMHKIHAKEFTLDDFSCEHLESDSLAALESVIHTMNVHRKWFIDNVLDNPKADWWQMIQLLPTSYNQKRTIMLNYEVLANMYKSRKNHKLDEWRDFCHWIESLPYSELITGEKENEK